MTQSRKPRFREVDGGYEIYIEDARDQPRLVGTVKELFTPTGRCLGWNAKSHTGRSFEGHTRKEAAAALIKDGAQ